MTKFLLVTTGSKPSLRVLLFTALFLFASGGFSSLALALDTKSPADLPGTKPDPEQNRQSGTLTAPRVFFVEPKDGATVTQQFKAKFGIQGMNIANAGQVTPGSGHHHLIIDGNAVKKGDLVSSDETHIHFGKGQTETTLNLKPGKHTLTLQFADGTHTSYGEPMSSTITVFVK